MIGNNFFLTHGSEASEMIPRHITSNGDRCLAADRRHAGSRVLGRL